MKFPSPLADYSSSLSVACPADREKVMKIKNKISCKIQLILPCSFGKWYQGQNKR